jgi:pimeloyl-ACP methyl ester carboxylesterase
MLKVLRFLRAYSRFPSSGLIEEEVVVRHEGVELPATFLRPAGREPYPGWIVLHGITVPGRNHPLMRRFVNALAATGAAVVIPDVESWRQLKIDIAAGDAAIQASARYLTERSDVQAPFTLLGFSFGATQALTGATLPGAADGIRSIVAFGGYCDFGTTLRFMMTGRHEVGGRIRQVLPDPYGRWIATANFLCEVPEFAGMTEVAEATLHLARESGRIGVFAGDPIYDRLKSELRGTLPPEQLEIWDLIAHPSGVTPPLEPGLRLADALATAAEQEHPELDPRPRLAAVDQKVLLAHGFDDRLIPFTETKRLREALPPAADVDVSITRLFSHSAEADGLGLLQYPREAARYFTLLHRALR